ncbi:hypothetical protein FPV67DRAFT_61254 [Lyophyllum atratum]|nr:hypothetical protein FPV67DRAFT_61254 [Lyophyllum atratum]
MPSIVQCYDILLDFTNDTVDCVTVQLLHNYGQNARSIVLLNPQESVTLVLAAGSVYCYAIKARTKVASVSARSWRDMRCEVSHVFSDAPSSPEASHMNSSPTFDGIRVDRHWRDHRFSIWNDT